MMKSTFSDSRAMKINKYLMMKAIKRLVAMLIISKFMSFVLNLFLCSRSAVKI